MGSGITIFFSFILINSNLKYNFNCKNFLSDDSLNKKYLKNDENNNDEEVKDNKILKKGKK